MKRAMFVSGIVVALIEIVLYAKSFKADNVVSF
jgi:hypothetical protein